MQSPSTFENLLQQLSEAHQSAQSSLHATYHEEIGRLHWELGVLRRQLGSHTAPRKTCDIDIKLVELQNTNASDAGADEENVVKDMPCFTNPNTSADTNGEGGVFVCGESSILLPDDLARDDGKQSSATQIEAKLRQSWTDHPYEQADSSDERLQAMNLVQTMIDEEHSRSMRLQSVASQKNRSWGQKWMAQPGANWRLVWDVTGAILIAYDTIVIPFGLSFQPDRNDFLISMDWATMLFWTMDMVFTFFVGYMREGQVVMSPYLIARRYLTTWFILDALVIAGDWFNNVGTASSGSGAGQFGRMARSLRTIRVLRLLRLLKLRRMMADFQDHISSEYTFLLLNLCRLLLFILFLNHGIACLWYWLGRTGYANGDPSWVEANQMVGRDLGYKYTTSMHWTLTQFTPASMEVMPKNTAERTMSVIVLVFALVAFGSFVGSISASMTALRTMNADTNKQFWMLRRFLKQQSVPKGVSRRILKYLEYVVELKQGKVQQSNIKILVLLSEQLRQELVCELTRPHLQEYELFKYMMAFPHMEVIFRRLCTFAFKQQMIASGDVVFYIGDEASHVYRVNNGHLLYQADGIALHPPIQEMEWLSEAAIWVPWKHMGRLSALAETELLAADVKIFAAECCKNVTTWRVVSRFANIFLEAFNACDRPVTDVIRDEKFHMALKEGCASGRNSVMNVLMEAAQPAQPRSMRSRVTTILHRTISGVAPH